MALLLDTLDSEIAVLDHVGSLSLQSLLSESSVVLSDLRDFEAELEDEISMKNEGISDVLVTRNKRNSSDFVGKLEKKTQVWYKRSIDDLKSYNGQITKFQRNIVNSHGFNVDLDGAYTFPLMLNSIPTKEEALIECHKGTCSNPDIELSVDDTRTAKLMNRQRLMESIVLHFLKTGHGNLVQSMLPDFGVSDAINSETLRHFLHLSAIVDDIREKHDIQKALDWLISQKARGISTHESTLFKFHMLQFVLILAGRSNCDKPDKSDRPKHKLDMALAAHAYAQVHFPGYTKDHLDDISSIMSLLVFKSTDEDTDSVPLRLLKRKIHQEFVHNCEAKKRVSKESRFVAELLEKFEQIHEMHEFFEHLATEVVQEFCKSMSLSTELSLFQTILAGHVNLPNFYKYSQLQQKLRHKSVTETSSMVAVSTKDLPFSLWAKNQFLFNFHPIFICPISKEQLVPLVSVKRVGDVEAQDRKRKQIYVSSDEVLVSPPNPVVVFEFCRHLALKESLLKLAKSGDTFKCHYCYKKHKLTDVSDAYFIDL